MRTARLGAVWATAVISSFVAPVAAQPGDDGDAEYTVSEYAYRRLEKAQEALEEKKVRVAHSTLTELSKRKTLTDYEKALMWQTWGYVYVTQENLPKAAEAMANAIALDALPREVQLSTRFNLGQVYLASEKPKQAVNEFEIWAQRVENPSPDALYTIAVGYAQAEQPAGAVRFIDRAIRVKKSVPDTWLQLKLASHVQLQQWGPAIAVLAELVDRKPDDVARWKQLSALYAQAGQVPESVASLEIAFRLGLLTEPSDIRLLAQNLVASGVPLKAAKVMRKALDEGWIPRSGENLELLATAYVNAVERDQAIEPLAQAAETTRRADLYEELGRINLAEKNWRASEAALARALSLGGLRQPGQTYVMLGMARHRQNEVGGARAAFEKALEYENSRTTAQSWLNYLARSN